ncbi:MAG: alpha/beta fold hydrolase [Flavobacteriales bacterium]|jgi:haloacetate dehalogenase|tara:strand:+ start:208 stop:1065 length:858 start_codon:yes stop_codon:yes gene_type:complete
MQQKIKTTRGLFAYRKYGKKGNPPVLLVHGWPQSSYCWHDVAQDLTDFYVIAPDLRGLGDSERTLNVSKYTKDQLGLDIFSIATALKIETFYLCGHDWGSAVAQEMALLQPERIRKLILINMIIVNNRVGKKKAAKELSKKMFRSSWYQFFQSIPKFPEQLVEGKEDVWIRFFCKGITNPIPEKALLEYIRCYQLPNTITTAANLYRSMPNDSKRWSHYINKKIRIPSHIIHGRLDRVVIPEFLSNIENAFKHPIDITYLEGGHFICDEQPKEVAKVINVFFSSN